MHRSSSVFARLAAPLLAAALALQASACAALVVSHARAPSGKVAGNVAADAGPPRRVSLVAQSLWGYRYSPETARFGEHDPDLRDLLNEELGRSGRFVACSYDDWDIRMDVLRHEANDAGNMEGPLWLCGLTLGLIPGWYSRELVLEVRATFRDGSTRVFTETDSYTRFMWILSAPFALIWDSDRAFRDMARNQFGRILEQL